MSHRGFFSRTGRVLALSLVLAAALPAQRAHADDITQGLILSNQVSEFIESFGLEMEKWDKIQRELSSLQQMTERIARYGKTFSSINSIANLTMDVYRTADQMKSFVTTIDALCSSGVISGSYALQALNIYETFFARSISLLAQARSGWKSWLSDHNKDEKNSSLIKVLDDMQDKLANGINILKKNADKEQSLLAIEVNKEILNGCDQKFRETMYYQLKY